MNKITAIYVRRSVSDKDKGNNSLSIDAQKADCIRYWRTGARYRGTITEFTAMTEKAARTWLTDLRFSR